MTTQPTPGLTHPVSIERPRVAYVMGSGRSGSTILGVTLGNCAGIFYAGELDAWLRTSGVPPQNGAERARFWGAVADEVGSEETLRRELVAPSGALAVPVSHLDLARPPAPAPALSQRR